jgi:hypothetical protein
MLSTIDECHLIFPSLEVIKLFLISKSVRPSVFARLSLSVCLSVRPSIRPSVQSSSEPIVDLGIVMVKLEEVLGAGGSGTGGGANQQTLPTSRKYKMSE